MKAKDDPTLERIRETRRRISAEHDHDPQRVVKHYIELQRKYQHRVAEDIEKRAESVEA
ncbi:MAG: hypothetical protein MSG64_13770 [Pyrinomonadaceae bacterium MAG19_C2-C3]|nr:hypothetical protein [Pyrinomonadaceae bacterium MAG19_C2-C3]